MLLGGGQEQGFRSGTTNTPALAGLAEAASEALQTNLQNIRDIRDNFESSLQAELPETIFHSRSVARLPNTSFFSLPGMLGEDVAETLVAVGIIVGTGAACSAGAMLSSKTLRSMGVVHEIAVAGLRVSLSRFTTQQDVSELISRLRAIRSRRRAS